MHFTVFGASGRVGSAFTRMALAAGHQVTAFSRSAEQWDFESPDLKKISGDIMDAESVILALESADAIVSAIAAPGLDAPEILYQGMETILAAARNFPIRHIAAVGGAGILQVDAERQGRDMLGFPDLFKPVSAAHFKSWQAIAQSGIPYTFMCPGDMFHGDPSEPYRTQGTFGFADRKHIYFESVADCILREMEAPRYLNERVAISF